MRTLLPTLLLVSACAIYVEEIESTSDEVRWAGWVLADLPSDDAPVLGEGTLVLFDDAGTPIAEGETDPDNPGWWQVDVSPETPVTIRIGGPNVRDTLWRATTPMQRAFWYYPLFALDTAVAIDLFTIFTEANDVAPPDAEINDDVWLLGQPWIVTETDLAAWTGPEMVVIDGAGTAHDVLTIYVDESGLVRPPDPTINPVAMFAVTGLEPGDIVLQVTGSDGRFTETTWAAESGDILSAMYFALPTES